MAETKAERRAAWQKRTTKTTTALREAKATVTWKAKGKATRTIPLSAVTPSQIRVAAWRAANPQRTIVDVSGRHTRIHEGIQTLTRPEQTQYMTLFTDYAQGKQLAQNRQQQLYNLANKMKASERERIEQKRIEEKRPEQKVLRIKIPKKPTIVEKFFKPKDISPEALAIKKKKVKEWQRKDFPKWVTDIVGDPLKLSGKERKLILPFYGKTSVEAQQQKQATTNLINYISKEVKTNPEKIVLFAALPPALKVAGKAAKRIGLTNLIARSTPHGALMSKSILTSIGGAFGIVYTADVYNRVREPIYTGDKDGKITTTEKTLPNGDIEITTSIEQIPQHRKPTGPEQIERLGGIFATELAPLKISNDALNRGIKKGYKPQPRITKKVKISKKIERAGKVIKTTPAKLKTIPGKIIKAPKKVKTKAEKAKEARDIKKRHEKAEKERKAKKEAELKRRGIKVKTKAEKAKEARDIKKRHEKAAKARLEKQKRLGITPKTKAQLAKEHAILKELHTKAAKSRLKTQQVKKHIESSRRLNLTRYKRLNQLIYNLNRSLDKLEKIIKKALALYKKLTLKDRKKQKKTFENLKRHMKNVKETRRELGTLKSELTKAKKHHDTRIKPSVIGKRRVGPRRTRETIRRERIKEEKTRREFDEEVKRIAEIEFDKKLTTLEKQDKYFHSKQGKMDAAIEFTEMTASNWGRTFKLIEPLPKPVPKGTYIVKGMTKAEKHAIMKARGEKAARERAKIRAAELKARDKKIKTPEEVKKEHTKMKAALVKAGKIKPDKKVPPKKRVTKDQEISNIIETQTASGTVMLTRVKTKVKQHGTAVHAKAKEATKTKVKTATATKLKQIESATRTQHQQLTTLYKSMTGLGVTHGSMLKVANTVQQKQKIRTQIKHIETEKVRIKELISELVTIKQLITIAQKQRIKAITKPRIKVIKKRVTKKVPPIITPVIPGIKPKKVTKARKPRKKVPKKRIEWTEKNPIPTLKSVFGI